MRFAVHEPATMDEALALLSSGVVPLAGGTDLLLHLRRRTRDYRAVVNLKRLRRVRTFDWNTETGLTIGALTTFRTLETSPLVGERFPALAEAAHVVAGVQLRNLATIGGNIGNASPSADSLPPLVALGASVEIASAGATRMLPVERCISGPGRTVLSSGEMFTAIHVPAPGRHSSSAFARFSPRSAMDIGIASAAAAVTLDSSGRCTSCRIAPGAVSPVPFRPEAAEAAVLGERITEAVAARAGELAAAAAQPISDIRGSADYRRAIVRVLTARVLLTAASRALGEEIQ